MSSILYPIDPTKISFSERISNGIGLLTITGIVFPRHSDFDPLGKMWGNVRRLLHKQSGIDSTLLSTYDNEQNLITCNFLLNTAVLKDFSNDSLTAYQEKFEQNFHKQMAFFEGVLIKFLKDKHYGYARYLELATDESLDAKAYSEAIDAMFDAFLISVKVKKPKKPKKD